MSIKNNIQKNIYKTFYHRDIPLIKENLRRLKNFGKLGFTAQEIFKHALNQRRFNLSPRKHFDYNGAVIFQTDFDMLKSCTPYALIMDKLLGKVLRKCKPDEKLLKEQFIKNFADFGFTLTFLDYCLRKKIDILEFEPKNPISSVKKLDLKIKIDERPVFVEIVSPIESTLKGKLIDKVIKEEVHNHNLSNFSLPLIIVVNLTDPTWSNNRLNAGLVSDKMFYPVSTLKSVNIKMPIKELSAVILKFGTLLTIYFNTDSDNKLTDQEVATLSKPFMMQLIKQYLKIV